MRFVTFDGAEFAGRSYSDIVHQMSAGKMEAVVSYAAYRRTTARKAKSMYGVDIDHSTDESFVKSLEKEGLMRRVK